jgi:hypothetical protein
MRLKAILAIAFLAACLTAAGLVVGMRRGVTVRPMQGFTLYISQTSYPETGDPIHTATKIRQQKSDGSWKLQTTYSNGRVDLGYGQPGRGVFAVDAKNQKLEYVSPSSPRGLADIDWTKEPGFVGEETILGYKTFHIHSENDGQYVDSYMCPALQGYPLKTVIGNGRTKTVWEVTQTVLGETMFEAAPDLPVSTKRFNEKLQR